MLLFLHEKGICQFCPTFVQNKYFPSTKRSKNIVTRVHGVWVSKRHYRSLKLHYRFLKMPLYGFRFFFFFKLDFEKIEFQKWGIFLISLGNGAKCCIFCPKRAFANFVQHLFKTNIFLQQKEIKTYYFRPTFFVLFEKSNFLREHHLLSYLHFKNV